MCVDIDTYRMGIGLHYCRQTKAEGIKRLESIFERLTILTLLLLICGDVETNPGPDIDSSLSNANSSSVTDPEKEIIKSKFSIDQNNVQSLANKVELIDGELHDSDYICLTETWLKLGLIYVLSTMIRTKHRKGVLTAVPTHGFSFNFEY